jgi:hypothetical protein
MLGSIVPEGEADIGLKLLGSGDFRIFLTAGVFSYINLNATPIISPVARLEISYGWFFIEGGARYGFTDNSIDPMAGIGFRF